MKKLLLVLMLLVIIVGCDNEEKTLVCTLHANDVINKYELNSTYNIYYKGKYVSKVEAIEEVESDETTILEYFEQTLNDTYQSMSEAYGGYIFNVTNENGKVTSKTTIDYTKINWGKFIEDQPAVARYVENDNMTIVGIKELYDTMGATCE